MTTGLYPPLDERRGSGQAKSSFLLLGYTIELLLKAALPALYRNCSKQLLSAKAKEHGHEYANLGAKIELPLSPADTDFLQHLSKIVLSTARYPVAALNSAEYAREWNSRTSMFWNEAKYKAGIELAHRIRKHVAGIDQNEKNSASFWACSIHSTGYLAFRCGGGLKPRIVVKYSDQQRNNKNNNKEDLFGIIAKDCKHPPLLHYWHAALFEEVVK